eukprot:13101279-Alexandrium_andersonii.AAC.1
MCIRDSCPCPAPLWTADAVLLAGQFAQHRKSTMAEQAAQGVGAAAAALPSSAAPAIPAAGGLPSGSQGPLAAPLPRAEADGANLD